MRVPPFLRYCIVIITGFYFFISSCNQATERRKIALLKNDSLPYLEIREGDSISLYWDPTTVYPDSFSYELYYRSQKDTGWTLLKDEIPNTKEPGVVIFRNEIDENDSIFYFGIRTVTSYREKSDFHFSLDSNANPSGGWILLWKSEK